MRKDQLTNRATALKLLVSNNLAEWRNRQTHRT